MLVKPLTCMNDSGLAVRKVLAREHAPLDRAARRRRRLRPAVRQAAVPRGRGPGGHNGLRSIIDELGTEKFSRLRVGIGAPERGFVDHVLAGSSPTSASGSPSCSTPRPTRSRSGLATARRRPRTGSTRSSSSARPTRTTRRRAARRGRRAARQRRRPPDEDRLAQGPPRRRRVRGREGRQPPVSDRYRGRTTRQRNVAEKVAREWAERRARPRPPTRSSTSSGRRPRRRSSSSTRPRDRTATAPPREPSRPVAAKRADTAGRAGRRVPDLAALPPLLPDTGSFASLRERLGPAREAPGMHGRHVGLTPSRTARRRTSRRRSPSPRPASGSAGSPATPRSATGSRRSWARGSAIPSPSPSSSRGRARVRAQRARRRRDRGAGRGAGGVARRRGPGPRGERPGARPAHDRARRPARRARDASRSATRLGRTRCSRELLDARLRAGPRGRRAGRVRPPRRHRRRVPAVGAAAGPDRVLRRRDRLAPRLRPDRPADRRHDRGGSRSCPRRSSSLPHGRRGRAPRRASAAGDAASRSGSPPTSPGSTGEATDPDRPPPSPPVARSPSATPPRSGRRSSRPSTGLDHLDPGTLLVLDEPGEIAEAAEFLWRQADERRAELVESGDLPKDWPSTYLAPRDVEAPARRRPDARAHLGVGAARGRGRRSRRRA